MISKRGRYIRKALFSFLALGIGIVVVIEFQIFQIQKQSLSKPFAQMLVLGAKVRSDGPSLSLISRLDLAVQLHKAKPEMRIVVSGGQGADEPMTEALAMANYLISSGINGEQIVLEDRSSNTYENILFSKPLIDSFQPLLIVTNDYHVIRACLLAQKMALDAYCAGAKTPSHVWLKLRLREYVAIVSFWIGSVV